MNFFNLFENSAPPVKFFGNLIMVALIVLTTIQFTTYVYEGDRSDFIEFSSPPRILNIDTFMEQHTFHRGDSFVLEYNIIKHEIGCYAEYQNVLSGPVDYQLPTRKSQFIGKRGTTSRNQASILVDLPRNIPKGVYKIQLAVFPVCDGVPRDAFRLSNPTPTIAIE